MTKVSRIPVEPEHMGRYLNDLWSSLTLLENKEEVRGFLKELLSHTEMKMLAKRLQIARMLREGHTYPTIQNSVRVQNSTIAKINNVMNSSREGYLKNFAEKLIAQKSVSATKEERRALERHLQKSAKHISAAKPLPYTFGTLQ